MKMTLVVDCGGSMTKIIYRLWKSSQEIITGYEWMSPEIENVTSEQLEEFFETLGWIGTADPKKQAYLKIGESHCVVGEFAQKFHAEDRIFELKYENALYKVLAAIGLILQRNGVNKLKKPLSAWLGVLLPWDEYSDRARFVKKLVSWLGGYQFRGQSIKVKASEKTVVVRPEGGGIYSSLIVDRSGEFFQGKRVGIGQFGHRNITGFYIEDGQIIEGQSPKLGMTVFLDEVVKNTSGLDRQTLLKAINAALVEARINRCTTNCIKLEIQRTIWVNNPSGRHVHYILGKTNTPQWWKLAAIKSLATARDEALREEEVKHISIAITVALKEYRRQVRKWLEKTFPKNLDCFIFSGGAVTLLLPEIEEYCNSYRRISTSTYYEREIEQDVYYFKTEIEAENPLYEAVTGYAIGEDSIELIDDRDLALRVAAQLNLS